MQLGVGIQCSEFARYVSECMAVCLDVFEERALIPAGRFHEMSYADLEQHPVGEMRKLYASLALPEFGIVEPALRTYLDSQAGYQKNVFPELAPDVRRHVATEWERCFDEWGYAR